MNKTARKAGVLMPISALPSKYGIGDFGHESYKFVDILAQMKVKIWQILPLTPLDFSYSPYQSSSAFAGEVLYISPDQLVESGLLAPDELTEFAQKSNIVDYKGAREHKEYLLQKAYSNFQCQNEAIDAFRQFIQKNSWLKNYALFEALKEQNNKQPWNCWPDAHKNALSKEQLNLEAFNSQIQYTMFLQFIFFQQWNKLKTYANAREIEIMGDIPIYLGFDSADVWERPNLFLLDENKKPTFVAGVPPDYFSKTGQRWGNPLYNWEELQAREFDFWVERLQHNALIFDIIRIDHFRAFDTYWKIPSNCKTAVEGEWGEAPGYALFTKIFEALPEINLVAEDLGYLRDEALELRDYFKIKGMTILQYDFSFTSDNPKLERINTYLYSGTHDNNTLIGWYNSLAADKQDFLNNYVSANRITIKEKTIKYLLEREAENVILPIQDILGLDEVARFNTPGTLSSANWSWKLANFSELEPQINFMRCAITSSNRA